MYKILGSDQKEYGPVSAEVLKQWIAERRVIPETLIMAEGGTEWKPLSSFPEFSAVPRPPLTTTPPLNVPTGQAQPFPRGATAPGAVGINPPGKTSGLAITSLVLGILSILSCGVTGLFALITGIIATSKISKSEGRLTGKGMAIAGLCMGGVTLILLPILAAMLLPALSQARSKAQGFQCVNNLKQLNLAIRMYASDNKDEFPMPNNWCDAIQNDIGNQKVLRCPGAPTGQLCSYGYNSRLKGKRDGEVNLRTVTLFEIDGGWNISGGPELMAKKPRHGGYNVAFADGSVEKVLPSRVSQLRWDP